MSTFDWYKLMEKLKDSTAHAEMISITSAANYLGVWRLNDCSLYVTKEPCLMCTGAIVNARINMYHIRFLVVNRL